MEAADKRLLIVVAQAQCRDGHIVIRPLAVPPHRLTENAIGQIRRGSAIRQRALHEIQDVKPTQSEALAGRWYAIRENGQAEPGFSLKLNHHWSRKMIEPDGTRNWRQELVFPTTADQQRRFCIPRNDNGACSQINRHNIERRGDLPVTVRDESIVNRARDSAIPDAFLQERHRLARQRQAQGFGSSSASLTINDHNRQATAWPFNNLGGIAALSRRVLVGLRNCNVNR
jgi:hypothetical protein